ncbi:flavin reductase family protein [Nonomuraea sp. NPDC049709]|uniref:flavin reductase family protein n=1 Tax=Nonomuraea sp. NPDC049709 TaxID=3154736 RepID=UPI00341E5523
MSIDPALLRRSLRHVPTSVAVVTSVTDTGRPVGMTVGSFASASLEPPLVSFFAGCASATWPLIHATGRFCVNVLAAHQGELGAAFAGSRADRFAGLTWSPGPLGSPVLDGVLAWLECELDSTYRVGDHHAVIGRVSSLEAREDVGPLVFHRGALAALG